MKKALVRTVAQVLEGKQGLRLCVTEDDEGRYGWIDGMLRRPDYRQPHMGWRGWSTRSA